MANIPSPISPESSRITTPGLLLQVVVAVGLLAIANVAVARLARNSVPRQLLRTIDASPDATLLAAGNSLMTAAFDPAVFHASWELTPPADAKIMNPVNIALGSSEPIEHLLLMRHALSRDPVVKVVVYGFYDLQMTEHPAGGWADLVGNRAMSYYVEPYFAADLYEPQSRLHLLQVGVISHVPMLVDRLLVWSKVEKLRRMIGEIGLPHEKTTQFGRASDFKAMEFGNVVRFQEICQQCADQQLPLAPAVELMIDLTHEHHAKFVAVEMPMGSRHRAVYYDTPARAAYDLHLRLLLEKKGALFIDASQWLPDEEFADSLHSGPRGEINFSRRLASAVKPMIAAN